MAQIQPLIMQGEKYPMSDKQLCNIFIEGESGKPKPKMAPMAQGGKAWFSWFAFLLGPVYFIHRKCYREAALICGVVIALSFVPLDFIPFTFFCIIYGFLFYPLYGRRAKKAIARARSGGLSEEDIRQLRKEGGVNLRAALAAAAVYAVLLALSIVLILGSV